MRWPTRPFDTVHTVAATLVTIGLLALSPASAHAQQPVDSAHTPQRGGGPPFPVDSAGLSGFFGSMVPAQIRATTMALEATWATLAKPENAAHLADFTKNYFDALVARGFTRDQALAIVMSIGIPHQVPGR